VSPPAEKILPGVSLMVVTELAGQLGVPCIHRDFTLDERLHGSIDRTHPAVAAWVSAEAHSNPTPTTSDPTIHLDLMIPPSLGKVTEAVHSRG